MGDVIKFRPRRAALDPEVMKIASAFLKAQDREATRRLARYGNLESSAELLRIFALYPMFRLTHANRARHCLYCDHRIEPFELHFVKDGSFVCQSGICIDRH